MLATHCSSEAKGVPVAKAASIMMPGLEAGSGLLPTAIGLCSLWALYSFFPLPKGQRINKICDLRANPGARPTSSGLTTLPYFLEFVPSWSSIYATWPQAKGGRCEEGAGIAPASGCLRGGCH
jgi:hypothetical protein